MALGQRMLLGAALVLCPVAARAQSFTMSAPKEKGQVESQVINGVEVLDRADWPATFTFAGLSHKPCTATAVGPQLVLTAAHCVGNRSWGNIVVAGSTVRVVCYRNPKYNAPEYDVAACVAESELALASKRDGFEKVATDPAEPGMGREIVLIGFGCTSEHGTGYGVLYFGSAKVATTPSQTAPSIATDGGAAACAGDSGGAAYIGGAKGERLIVGINSKATGLRTELTALTDPLTLGFVRGIDTPMGNGHMQKAKICGIDKDLRRCR